MYVYLHVFLSGYKKHTQNNEAVMIVFVAQSAL